MNEKKDFLSILKKLGIKIYNATIKKYKAAKDNIEKQILKEKLRKRFNYENPYKVILLDSPHRVKLADSFLAKHAKRYNEDDIFVFFGTRGETHLETKHRIKDLSDNSIYEILELVEVMIPVTLNGKEIDVLATAANCKGL